MRITRRAESLEGEALTSHFSGPAHFNRLHESTDLHPLRVNLVSLEPGSRSDWHSHSGGQLLYIVQGEGWVQERGQAPQRVEAGDVVASGPGEEHWHGAGKQAMAHLAVTMGDSTWMDPAKAPHEG
jgi:quercetin dioxygenase-like cupin family protein